MIFAALLSLTTMATPVTAPAELSSKDREFAAKYLEETRRKFLDSIEGLSEAQWTFKAGPDRWSIAEVAEHIAISESTILGLVTSKIVKGPASAAGGERLSDQRVVDSVVDRSARFEAPEMLKPANRWATRDALKQDFNAARDKTIAYVKETNDDLRGHAAPHPVLKELDGYQWVLLIGAHAARHTAQIEEVKSAAGYPK